MIGPRILGAMSNNCLAMPGRPYKAAYSIGTVSTIHKGEWSGPENSGQDNDDDDDDDDDDNNNDQEDSDKKCRNMKQTLMELLKIKA